jgi:hypothetical protein
MKKNFNIIRDFPLLFAEGENNFQQWNNETIKPGKVLADLNLGKF